MVYKSCDAQVPQPGELTEQDQQLLSDASALLETWRTYFQVQDFYRALGAAWKVLDDANSYFADQQPWVLRKTDEARMQTVLWVTLEVVRRIGLLIQAAMPEAATKLLDALGVALPRSIRSTGIRRSLHA